MQEITSFQWLTLALGGVGFLSTWTIGIVGFFKIIDRVKEDTAAKIAAEAGQIEEKIAELISKFDEDQKSQDHRFGEVGIAMRQKISDVEKEMHQIEIWGRDHYVLKSEFVKATDQIRADIKAMAADIKVDIRELKAEITASLE